MKLFLFLLFNAPFLINAQTNTFPSNGNVGIGTTSPRSKFETVGRGQFSSGTNGSSIYIDVSSLPTDNNYSNVKLVAGSNNGSGYFSTALDNYGGFFNWLRGSPAGYVEAMRLDASNGYLGIGTPSPAQLLHVKSPSNTDAEIRIDVASGLSKSCLGLANAGADYGKLYFDNSNNNVILTQNYQSGYLGFGTNGRTNDMVVSNSGGVGIGTTDPQGYKLAVNGDAIFTKVKVKTYATWPDYVFNRTYGLPPLKDLETYIKLNNHLPDVPPASEVEKNGLDLGDNQALLLKKIEELTLYIIDQDKKIDVQNMQLKSQQKQITELLELKKDLVKIKSQLKAK